jgi:replicative DNA helicase
MIGEHFINVCLKSCCSIDNRKYNKSKELFNNINIIFKIYQEENEEDVIPTEFKDKLKLAEYLSEYRLKAKFMDFNKFAQRIEKGKYKDFLPLLNELREELDEEEMDEMFSYVLDKRKIIELTKGANELERFMEDLDSGNYTDDKELIYKWENNIEKLHQNLIDVKKIEMLNEVSTLNMINDDFLPVLEKFKSNIDEKETIKTGYKKLDEVLSSKGFEKRRLVLIGGTSGVGKSAFLINLLCNAINYNNPEFYDDDETDRTYLYITAENLIDESWARYYCCLTGTPYSQLLEKINIVFKEADEYLENNPTKYNEIIQEYKSELESEIKDIMKKRKSNVIFKYVQPRTTTVKDIEAIIDMVKSENNLQAVYVDYLDLLSSGMNVELRLEQGYISQELKNIAVSNNIAMFTVTQLNREGYNTKGSSSMIQMGESMKKIDNSDFVLFLQKPEQEEDMISSNDGSTQTRIKRINMSVLKNRNGKIGLQNALMIRSKSNGEDIFNFRIEEMAGIKTTSSFDNMDNDSNGEYDVYGFDDEN